MQLCAVLLNFAQNGPKMRITGLLIAQLLILYGVFFNFSVKGR